MINLSLTAAVMFGVKVGNEVVLGASRQSAMFEQGRACPAMGAPGDMISARTPPMPLTVR